MTGIDRSGLGAWADLPFFERTMPRIEAALAGRAFLPPAPEVFAALRRTQPDATRVLILGQDPYPTPGHANGLAFSVAADVRPLPRSLGNIYKELTADVGAVRENGDLGGWADQGVLLLNAALTVPPGEANGHQRIGWSALVDQVLDRLDDRPRALLLWGRFAQMRAASMVHPGHLRIETAHPSPLSAARGFFGSRPFSRINRWLADQGQTPIDWAA